MPVLTNQPVNDELGIVKSSPIGTEPVMLNTTGDRETITALKSRCSELLRRVNHSNDKYNLCLSTSLKDKLQHYTG